MGEVVFVVGKSGAGKSYSLRNLEPGTVGVFSVGGKRLPFKGGVRAGNLGSLDYKDRYSTIERKLRENRFRAYVVDDSSFLQADENLERALEKGDQFRKFLEIGVHLARLVQVAGETDDDTIVYFMHHIDVDDYGTESIRSIGKLVAEKYNPIERCNVVIDAMVRDGRHVFETQPTGSNLAKSPPGMLEPEMDNDLAEVDRRIREFWGLAPIKREEEQPETKES